MKRFSSILRSLSTLILLLSLSSSCTKEFDFGFKDLCFYHPHTAPIKLNVDWSKFSHIEQPTGMTVYVWPQNEGEELSRFVTHNLDAVTLDLEAGYFHAFAFNQSDTEYATIEFYNLQNYEKAEARVKQIKSNSWYTTKKPETKLGTEPEWLAIDCIENIEVTEEMVEIAEHEYLYGRAVAKSKSRNTKAFTKTQNDVGPLIPTSIIKSVDVYIHIENIFFLYSAAAFMEGMAEGCHIASGNTTEGQVVQPIESGWSIIYDKDSQTGQVNKLNGMIKASITTFGVPSTHRGLPQDNYLQVRLLLSDKETIIDETFAIGDQLSTINSYDGTQLDENGCPIWPEVHVYLSEPLPAVVPEVGSDGAFNVGVGGWDDEIVTVLPLM